MLRLAKNQIHRSLAAVGYRLVRDDLVNLLPQLSKPPSETAEPPYVVALRRAAGNRPIPPKMLDRDYPGVEDIEVHLRRYGIDSVLERRFYNIGAAWNRHACWTMVDHPS